MANTLTIRMDGDKLNKAIKGIEATMKEVVLELMAKGMSNLDACECVAGMLGCSVEREPNES